jgi:hypothetical protein
MSNPLKAILFWTPRLLASLFILFLMMFSLDVFEMGGGFGMILLGLLMHNLPPLILLVVLVVCWRRWEWLPALAFGLFVLWYAFFAAGRAEWSGLLILGIPAILVCVLFLLGWIWRRQIRG